MGWCRGKISEGLDFSDYYARLDCIIGIPNITSHDQKIKYKLEFLGNKGKSWYFQ